MLQRDDVGGPPRLNFEAWRDLLRSNCGGEVEVTAPKVFAGWMRPINACGLEAASVKIQWGSADLGSFAQRVERTHRDIRLDGADHYLVVFQVAGQSAMTQIDQTVQLDVGDVALVDAARPVKYLCRVRSPQWLTLRLPRKSVQSHLGFEPQGGVSRHNTRAGRALFDLIRDGIDGLTRPCLHATGRLRPRRRVVCTIRSTADLTRLGQAVRAYLWRDK